jgi:hypothetical protein
METLIKIAITASVGIVAFAAVALTLAAWFLDQPAEDE